jgi:cyclophilin family peptidyl-prolyl cis-trans isomerase
VRNFVIQGGDPTGSGRGGPGYTVEEEPNEVSNKKYTVSMAKTQGSTEFGSQFFINAKDNPALDATAQGNRFYPFGEVRMGRPVVDAIAALGTESGVPSETVTITDVRIVTQER